MMKRIKNFIYDRVVLCLAELFRKKYEIIYFKKLRKNLKNSNFSIFSPNCYAGIMYHRLGLPFTSPTINMFFPIKKQYLKFISNIRYYIKNDLVFIEDESYDCPVAMLDDVKIVFNHYRSNEEAAECWNRRKERINYDNIFLIFDDINDVEYSDILEFQKIDCKGKVVFTANEYPEIPSAVQIKKYKESKTLKPYLLDKSVWTGKNIADKYFNFVEWLNGNNS